MSKGSARRPGTGYAENWERVFGKKPNQHQFGNTLSKADQWKLETMAAEMAGRIDEFREQLRSAQTGITDVIRGTSS